MAFSLRAFIDGPMELEGFQIKLHYLGPHLLIIYFQVIHSESLLCRKDYFKEL